MEFAWAPEQVEYRARVRKALNELLPADWEENYVPHSYGSDVGVDFSREFCPALAERGLLVPHWPKEYGGQESSDWNHFILNEEMKAAHEPRGGQYMNVNWIGPTLMKFGTPEQQAQHLAGIASGKVVWCQGFSEPDAGTDLAALRTRATRDGDDYVINGSKIWTSYARRADWCFLLARTGQGRKQISIFLVPMTTPGISVTSFNGLPKFGHLNEVYFTDVRVSAASRVGEEGQAWPIIAHALSFERVGVPRYHTGLDALDEAVAKLKADGRFDDPAIRARAGAIVARFEGSRLLTYNVVDQRVKRMPPGTDGNLARIWALEAVQDLLNFLAEFVPESLQGTEPLLEDYFRINIPAGITGGTNEIQLDLIAQRGLDLPRA